MTSVFGTVINTSIAWAAILQSGSWDVVTYLLALGDDIDLQVDSLATARNIMS